MVAKDYPFYLTVKRANCSLEVPPTSNPAKDAEVEPPPGPVRVRPSCLSFSISLCPFCVTASPSTCLILSVPLSLFFHSHTLPPVSLPPFLSLSVNPARSHLAVPVPIPVPLPLGQGATPSSPLLPAYRALRRFIFCLDSAKELSWAVSAGPDVRKELPFEHGLPLAWAVGGGGSSGGPLRIVHLSGLASQLFGSKDRTQHFLVTCVCERVS